MENLQLLREAVANKTAKVLTVDLAKELKGRKIKTIYFGYRGQDGTDEFIIGDILPEPNKQCLYTSTGRNTYMYAHSSNHGAFTCSDIDRFVYFIEVEDEN